MTDTKREDVPLEHVLLLKGHFTWDFGQNFFIETTEGNFIWSCPDYNGDNSLVATSQTYSEYMAPDMYGRDKGDHIIGDYIKAKGNTPL